MLLHPVARNNIKPAAQATPALAQTWTHSKTPVPKLGLEGDNNQCLTGFVRES